MPPRPTSRTRALPLLLGALLSAATPRAFAGEADDMSLVMAKESFDLAEKAYALGKFDDALRHYERAFELKQLPALLFNIGQCHRNLGNWERASFFYQGYLSREPKAKNRDKVQALIEQMDAKVREQEEAKRAAVAAPGANPARVDTGAPNAAMPSPSAPPPEAARPGVAVVPPAATTPPAPTESTPLYRSGWLWAAVGVVVVGGIVAAVVATNPSVSADNLNGTLGGPIDASR